MARRKPTENAAIEAVNEHGLLLVYPITNRAQPLSLWHVLHPGVEMQWAWDAEADPRVGEMWQLRERLARGKHVVYAKWYKGRAVFFSRELFVAMLAQLRAHVGPLSQQLTREGRELLSLLSDDSPQSSKNLRREAGLTGKQGEALWTRALRELWERLLIVGTGEVDDGAFPSLLIGATQLIFEELWEEAGAGVSESQLRLLAKHLPSKSLFGQHWLRTLQRAAPQVPLQEP